MRRSARSSGSRTKRSLFILGWLGGVDVEREVAGLGPGELDLADVDVGVVVDEVDEELFDVLVLGLTDQAVFLLWLVLMVFIFTGLDVVGDLDLFIGHLVLVELHVLLLGVARNVLTGDLDGLLILDLLILRLLLSLLGFDWGGVGLRPGGAVGGWLFVGLSKALLHVLVDLAGASIGAFERFQADAVELGLLGAQVGYEVVEQRHRHLGIKLWLGLGLGEPSGKVVDDNFQGLVIQLLLQEVWHGVLDLHHGKRD